MAFRAGRGGCSLGSPRLDRRMLTRQEKGVQGRGKVRSQKLRAKTSAHHAMHHTATWSHGWHTGDRGEGALGSCQGARPWTAAMLLARFC